MGGFERFCWIVTSLAAIGAAALLSLTLYGRGLTEAQQATFPLAALGVAVIPYVFSRAIQALGRNQHEKATEQVGSTTRVPVEPSAPVILPVPVVTPAPVVTTAPIVPPAPVVPSPPVVPPAPVEPAPPIVMPAPIVVAASAPVITPPTREMAAREPSPRESAQPRPALRRLLQAVPPSASPAAPPEPVPPRPTLYPKPEPEPPALSVPAEPPPAPPVDQRPSRLVATEPMVPPAKPASKGMGTAFWVLLAILVVIFLIGYVVITNGALLQRLL